MAIKIQPWLKITHAKKNSSMQQIKQPWEKLEKSTMMENIAMRETMKSTLKKNQP